MNRPRYYIDEEGNVWDGLAALPGMGIYLDWDVPIETVRKYLVAALNEAHRKTEQIRENGEYIAELMDKLHEEKKGRGK
jgi:hypothetical protein